jgi:hypothetical protein
MFAIDEIDIVPLLSSKLKTDTINYSCNTAFIEESKNILEQTLTSLNARKYSTKKGVHCKFCQLKPHCPAYTK